MDGPGEDAAAKPGDRLGHPASLASKITALSNTKFLVDERDGNFEPNAHKVLYEVDL